ncbi:AAA family ATPase [Streptomyces pactum]|uniref:AAA family ATPase n=1 Tax=Streptomyces pactum TaxID=68249 RepID=UPI0036FA7198
MLPGRPGPAADGVPAGPRQRAADEGPAGPRDPGTRAPSASAEPSADGAVDGLCYPLGDVVVVSGLPGSGKSTLMRRTVAALDRHGGPVLRVDSQDTRERWEAALPARLPYGLYRPLVRLAHYAGLRRALRSGAGLVVHDCGTQSWVRRWLARHARRRGRVLHMVLLDVPPAVALDGQVARGRGVSGYAFRRHRRAVRRLVADAERGRLPRGCASVVLLDRPAADRLRTIDFG